MKAFITTVLIGLFALPSFARITYENGYGQEGGTCRASNASLCIDMLKQRSERSALREARSRCDMQRGYVVGTYCNSNCSPSYIPPGGHDAYVICRSSCQVQCQIN